MARPRVPKARAIATGRVLHDPKRFRDRKEPVSNGPLGNAPKWMKNKDQIDSWNTFRVEVPWLNKSHRCLTAIACIARAGIGAGGEFNVRMANLLRQCLGQMGATPADASKINLPNEGEPEDPSRKYFQ